MGRMTPNLPALVGMPSGAKWLGLAGLLPQLACVAVLVSGNVEWRFAALAIAWLYAALILSFLGGTWWGLAARQQEPSAGLFAIAVVPSLVALATIWPWLVGDPWPQPSLFLLGLVILASPFVDAWFYRQRLTPAWWMGLRVPLSIGLGLLTMIASGFGTPVV